MIPTMYKRYLRVLLWGGVALVSAACGPALVWQKPGGTDAQYQSDDSECRGRVGVAQVIPGGSSPSTYGGTGSTPAMLTPYSQGSTGPRSDLQDYRDCMEGRGYQLAPAPARPGG
jgi:hypothetical protein